jgi:hypothetical protein
MASLADMRRIYNRIADLIGDADLPEDGFATLDTWQQQQQQLGQARSAAAATGEGVSVLRRDVLVRLQACRAFSEGQLIWLPDESEVRTAAVKVAASAAAAQQYSAGDGYYEDPGWIGGCSSRGPGRWQQRQQQQRQAGKARQTPAAATTAAAVQEDVMYDADVMNSLQRERMRGRFYSPEQLRFYDEARVLEVISLIMAANTDAAAEAANTGIEVAGSATNKLQRQDAAAAAADAASQCLRVAGLYYGGGLQELFVRQLQRFKYNSWIPLIVARQYLLRMTLPVKACRINVWCCLVALSSCERLLLCVYVCCFASEAQCCFFAVKGRNGTHTAWSRFEWCMLCHYFRLVAKPKLACCCCCCCCCCRPVPHLQGLLPHAAGPAAGHTAASNTRHKGIQLGEASNTWLDSTGLDPSLKSFGKCLANGVIMILTDCRPDLTAVGVSAPSVSYALLAAVFS